MQAEDVTPPLPSRNLIDRVVEWISPASGLRRQMAREVLATRAYLAGASDRWRPKRSGASAEADWTADSAALRAKSRFLVQNVDYIAAGMRWRSAVKVGTGILPKWTGRDGKRLKELWDQWAPYADADGLRDIYGLQRDADATMDRDGMVMLRIRPRRVSDGLPVPIQFQLLEIDWLDTTRQTADGSGNDVINGREYDGIGRVVAYWLWDHHPGDTGRLRMRGTKSRRVPASQIICLFAPDRPGAGAGFPRLSPVITRARDLQVLEDAEIARKKQESALSVLASGDINSMTNGVSTATSPTTAISLGRISGGGIIGIPAGLNTTVIEPKAAPGFVEYCKYNVHMICSGGGFSYEAATGDVSETNFSSARVRQMDLKREIQQETWLTLIPGLCQPLCDAFANAAALAGLLGSGRMTPSYTVQHNPPRWDYVNPLDEIEAKLKEIGGAQTSISAGIRANGDDREVVFQELEEDIKDLQRRGIWTALIEMRAGKAQAPQQTPPGAAGA